MQTSMSKRSHPKVFLWVPTRGTPPKVLHLTRKTILFASLARRKKSREESRLPSPRRIRPRRKHRLTMRKTPARKVKAQKAKSRRRSGGKGRKTLSRAPLSPSKQQQPKTPILPQLPRLPHPSRKRTSTRMPRERPLPQPQIAGEPKKQRWTLRH